MRIEEGDGATRVYFRQSWVNTWLMCGERGRRDMLDHDGGDNEFSCLGTAFHAGVEAALTGDAQTPMDVANVALEKLVELEPLFEYNELNHAECAQHLLNWSRQLRHTVEFKELYADDRRQIEFPFAIHVATHPVLGVEQWWEGTIDAVSLNQSYVVDWKTSSRQYQRWERQRWAVQPTFYGEAVRRLLGFDSVIDFRYLVFERSKRTQFAQSVQVWRGPEHTRWVASMLWKPFEDRFAADWPLNDQHALCSEKWCPYWAECKGAYIAPDFQPVGRK